MRSHRSLDTWKVAMELARECHRLTDGFPSAERFGMTSQLRRAAVSIPANIAEGCGRASRGEVRQFLSVARGSLKELETVLELAIELGFGVSEQIAIALALADRLSRLLWKLRRSLD